MAKKIGAIISLSIIGILLIATIIMANVTIDYSINCKSPIYVYVNNKATTVEQQNKIVEYINSTSKQNGLSALFNGSLNNEAKLVSTGTKTLSQQSGYTIEYYFNEPQDLMQGNKKYTDNLGQTYTYERLVFAVTSANEDVYKVYVIPEASERNTYTYYYELEADFGELYTYLNTTF